MRPIFRAGRSAIAAWWWLVSAQAAVLVLALATHGVLNGTARFAPVSAEPLNNLDFSLGVRHWSGRPAGLTLIAGTPPELRLSADPAADGRPSFVLRPLPALPAGQYWRMRLELAGEGLRPGPDAWQRGNVIVQSFDVGGARLRHWPYQIARLEEPAPWHVQSALSPGHSSIAAARLVIFNGAESGILAVRGLRIERLRERAGFRWARWGVFAGWLLVGLGLAGVLVRAARRRPSGLIAVAAGTVLVLIALAPQPHLRIGIETAWGHAIDAFESDPGTVAEAGPDSAGAGPSATARGRDAAARPGAGADPSADEKSQQNQRSRATATQGAPAGAAGGPRRDARSHPMAALPESDRLAHFFAFALFSLLVAAGFRDGSPWPRLGALLLFAAAGEYVQVFVPTRESQWSDLAHNIAGIGFGFGLALAAMTMVRARRAATA